MLYLSTIYEDYGVGLQFFCVERAHGQKSLGLVDLDHDLDQILGSAGVATGGGGSRSGETR